MSLLPRWSRIWFELSPFAPLASAFVPFLDADDLPPVKEWPSVRVPNGPEITFGFHEKRRRGASFTPADLYDGQIVTRGVVPSRENNWHDFFNMIAWRAFPRAKHAIHTSQYAGLREALGDGPRTTLPNTRLALQDRLALLDEACFVVLLPENTSIDGREELPLMDREMSVDGQPISAFPLLPFGHGLCEFLVGEGARRHGERVPAMGDGRGFVLPVRGPRSRKVNACSPDEVRGLVDEAVAALCSVNGGAKLPMGRRLGWSFCASWLGWSL